MPQARTQELRFSLRFSETGGLSYRKYFEFQFIELLNGLKVCHSEEAQRADVGISSTEVSTFCEPINIGYPRFTMLINIFSHLTATLEIATPV